MMVPTSGWIPVENLKPFARQLALKMACIAGGWVILYFATFWMNRGMIAPFFAPMIGAFAGLVIGWVLAEKAVEEAGFSGLVLWVILVLAAWISIWLPEFLVGKIFWGVAGGFGRWLLLTAAMLLSLATAVWRASVDD